MFIGKILRKIDAEPIRITLARRSERDRQRVHNEHAIEYLFEQNKLPSLTTVDLSDYHMPMTPPRDAPGFMMRLEW